MRAVFFTAVLLDLAFFAMNVVRERAVPGTLARVRAATRQVLLGIGPLGFPVVWLAYLLQVDEPVVRALVALVVGPLVAFNLIVSDLPKLRAAWRESRWPGRWDRLRTAVHDRLADRSGQVAPSAG